jgi:hypothetical protein
MYSDLHHENYQRLHDAAKPAAVELRRQAISAFWRQAGRVATRAFHALRRPAALHLPREA